ncbi:MAG: hypothetical protein H7839_02525 [Magnetococcus sp. YQC-5]
MEDAATRFEQAATLTLTLLETSQTEYQAEWNSLWKHWRTNLCTFIHTAPENAHIISSNIPSPMKQHLKRLFQQLYLTPLRKLIKQFSDTHLPASRLLEVLGLPTELPQSLLNQLLIKKNDIESALSHLGEQTQSEWLNDVIKVSQQQRPISWLEYRLQSRSEYWRETGQQLLLDGRMAYFRTILHLMGQRDGRAYFLYAGSIGPTTRPFCAVRTGRVFDLGEVMAWDKMVWVGQIPGAGVMERCGGSNCRHLLLPVQSNDISQERFSSRILKPAPPTIRTRRDTPAIEVKKYWNSNTLAGQWHDAAFGRSLEYLRRAVGLAGEPTGGIHNSPGERRMMFILENGVPRIEMGQIRYQTGMLRLEKLVWRHEFGHYMDYMINGFRNGPFSFRDPELRRARLMDSRVITMRAGLTGSAAYRLRTRIRTSQVLHALMQQRDALNKDERLKWFDGEFRSFGLTLEQVESALRVDTVYRGFQAEQHRLVVLLTALRRQDALLFGEHVLEWRRKRHQELGMSVTVADFFGSMTGSVVGHGHTLAYYREHPSRYASESFANGVALLGDGNLFWTRVLQILSPRFTMRMIDIMKNFSFFSDIQT